MQEITKAKALNAWERLDAIIDSLDWQGVFDEQELQEIEESMTIMYRYISSQKEG